MVRNNQVNMPALFVKMTIFVTDFL